MSYKKSPFTTESEVEMLTQDTTTHYYVLGLPKTATQDDIKKAFRRLARACHPDVVGHRDPAKLKDAEERFKRINYAHDVLGNPESRREYDRIYSPNRFVATEAPAPTYEYSFAADDPSMATSGYYDAYPILETQRYQDAWDEFISKPFEWTDKSMRFYLRWEWTLAAPSLVVMYLFLADRSMTLHVFEFLLTTHSNPGVESAIPVHAMLTGAFYAVVLTVICVAYAALTHPYSFVRNAAFRSRLGKLALDLMTVSVIVFGTVGLLIGRYFF